MAIIVGDKHNSKRGKEQETSADISVSIFLPGITIPGQGNNAGIYASVRNRLTAGINDVRLEIEKLMGSAWTHQNLTFRQYAPEKTAHTPATTGQPHVNTAGESKRFPPPIIVVLRLSRHGH